MIDLEPRTPPSPSDLLAHMVTVKFKFNFVGLSICVVCTTPVKASHSANCAIDQTIICACFFSSAT